MSDCRWQETSRVGLYAMVFLILLQTCGTPSIDEIRNVVRQECGGSK